MQPLMFDIAKDMPYKPQKYALYWLTNYLSNLSLIKQKKEMKEKKQMILIKAQKIKIQFNS